MPALARKGDPEVVHCATPYRQGHVKTVFANGINLSCEGHSNTVHAGPVCVPHTAVLSKGSPNVYAEGIPVGRVGDPTCTSVAKGSPDCYANGY